MAFTLKQGATFRVEVDLQNADGSVMDLTDYTLVCELRQEVVDVTRTYPLVLELSVTILDIANGLIQIEATPSATASWPVGCLVFDVEMTDGAGDVTYTPTWNVTVCERITNNGG